MKIIATSSPAGHPKSGENHFTVFIFVESSRMVASAPDRRRRHESICTWASLTTYVVELLAFQNVDFFTFDNFVENFAGLFHWLKNALFLVLDDFRTLDKTFLCRYLDFLSFPVPVELLFLRSTDCQWSSTTSLHLWLLSCWLSLRNRLWIHHLAVETFFVLTPSCIILISVLFFKSSVSNVSALSYAAQFITNVWYIVIKLGVSYLITFNCPN